MGRLGTGPPQKWEQMWLQQLFIMKFRVSSYVGTMRAAQAIPEPWGPFPVTQYTRNIFYQLLGKLFMLLSMSGPALGRSTSSAT